MSREVRNLTLFTSAFLIGTMVLLALLFSLISPIWCDVPGINFLTCMLGRDENRDYRPELILEETPEVSEENTNQEEQPEPEPTVMLYDDIEDAASDDPLFTAFLNELKRAVEEKDYQTIEGLIAEPFNIAPYGGEYSTLSKVDAIKRLSTDLEGLNLLVDISNEGRIVAQELYVTPREASFALICYGWPEGSFSILGLTQVEDTFLWSDTINFPRQ
jgi:hypothetical protein